MSCTTLQFHSHRDHGLLNLCLKTTLRGHSGIPGGDKVPDDFPHCVVDLLVQVLIILRRGWNLTFSKDKVSVNEVILELQYGPHFP